MERCGATVIRSRSNLGFAAAVNLAARGATEDYLFLLSPGFVAGSGALDVLADAAERDIGTPCFCGHDLTPDGTQNRNSARSAITPRSALFRALGVSQLFSRSPFANPEAIPDWDRKSDREIDITCGPPLLIRTDAWKAIGEFDPRYWMYAEQAEWQLRASRHGLGRPRFVADAGFTQASSTAPHEGPNQNRRAVIALRARATLMRTACAGATARLAPALLRIEAYRHGVQYLCSLGENDRSRLIWRSRGDWIPGYPEPHSSSGKLPKTRRFLRLIGGVLDPRAYIHMLRIVNYWNYTHARPRRSLNLGRKVEISPDAVFANPTRIEIGARSIVTSMVRVLAGGIHGRIRIGENVMIGPGALLTAATYRTDEAGPFRDRAMEERDVIVEDNVWIGAGAVVLPGVHIGTGAIIGAGSVVTKDVPAGAVHVSAASRVVRDCSNTSL
jgi:acetyltransferase-like isoleucine patch superfamily enzyme/GT2 family glycosyltransferase